jgi:hypothetical protein
MSNEGNTEVYVVTRTSTVESRTKQIIKLKDGTLLDMPYEVQNSSTIVSSELVTELGDVSPVSNENSVETEEKITKFTQNILYKVFKYERVQCPIAPQSIYAMYLVNIANTAFNEAFCEWLLQQVGKSIYVGTSGQGSYFAHPKQNGSLIMINAKLIWRH